MQIRVCPEQKGKALGNLFGLFFEDLNHAADGGLYAELLQNRDFEFDSVDRPEYTPLTGWAPVGHPKITLRTEDAPFSRNPHYVRVQGRVHMGISNLGYGEGIPAQKGRTCRLTLWARSEKSIALCAGLCGARAVIELGKDWEKHEVLLTPEYTDCAARLLLTAQSDGSFEIAFASLMPLDTWKGRKNGLRADLVEALAEMKPRFLRFPGGCLTHDGQLDPDARDGIYNWKRTLGPVENRPGRRNNWGYHQTMGIGFYEYFLLCEDLNCEPLPVVNGGLDPHHLRFAQGELLEEYIRDAVELIEFAKGSTDTYWGGIRAEMGHPEPFRLRYLAVGNEEIHQEFHENMTRFAQALRKADPEIELIGSAGPVCDGKPYEMGWEYARRQKLEYVDEHYYQAPEWFLANVDHYASYPADGPKVFLGEYASWGNRMENALAEAAYMTELQKAPAVALACYAPMFCNVHYVNWQPDMIWFDGHRVCRTVNYHVQSMFMRHQGDTDIPVETDDNRTVCEQEYRPSGRISVLADDTDMLFDGIRLETADGNREWPKCELHGEEEMILGSLEGDFTLTLHCRRNGGKKGILIRFGWQDEDNYDQWTLGGWQNSDSGIEQRIRGRSSCLTQNNFSMQDGKEYEMTLQVKGNVITAFINGEQVHHMAVRPLVTRQLYLASSVEEENGAVILKAVNIHAEDVSTEIEIPCESYTAETLQGAPESRNTLESPDAVVPKVTTGQGGNRVAYTFPGHSVTVLRFRGTSR